MIYVYIYEVHKFTLHKANLFCSTAFAAIVATLTHKTVAIALVLLLLAALFLLPVSVARQCLFSWLFAVAVAAALLLPLFC